MSTPTAIEIVREHVKSFDEIAGLFAVPVDAETAALQVALAAVLRDAERFKALERAHENGEEMEVRVTDGLIGPRGRWCHWSGTLSELADRLKNEGAK